MSDQDEMMDWIDSASYEDLLRRNRYGKIGDPIFIGDVGAHFAEVMAAKKSEVGHGAAVAASKRIGWDSP